MRKILYNVFVCYKPGKQIIYPVTHSSDTSVPNDVGL